MGNTKLGRMSINVTNWLSTKTDNRIDISPANLKYGIDQVGSGALRAGGRVFETVGALGQGQLPEAKSTFILNRFFKSLSEDEVARRSLGAKKEDPVFKALQKKSSDEVIQRSRRAWNAVDAWQVAETKREKTAIMRDLLNSDPRAFDLFKRYRKNAIRGLNYFESQLKEMDHPQRAEYLMLEMNNAKPEERKELFKEYRRKKILIGKTFQEMKKLGFEKP